MDDYKDTLADAARETLGSEFKVYRLMEKEDALKMLIDGEFPNIKRLQEDEEGDESYQDVIINMMGEETPMSREFFSFSLSPKEALSFRFLSAGGRGDKKDEDFVLIEMKANPTDIVMRGHESEKDLILRVDGETAGSSYVTPKIFNVYDFKFSGKNQIELFENEQFKNFVIKSQKDDISEAAIQSKKLLEKEEDTTPGIGHNQPPSSIEEQTEKLLEDKELDVSQQTKNLTSKITLEKVKSDVKFKQSKYANTTDVYYKGKKYAEIEKRTDIKKLGGLSDYYLKYPSGTFVDGEEVFTTEDAELGFNNAKDALTQGIYNDLKRKK
tara:strand:- start:11 stop:988 length:978 start_codon:yes stop_codon:yes gene_type:complete